MDALPRTGHGRKTCFAAKAAIGPVVRAIAAGILAEAGPQWSTRNAPTGRRARFPPRHEGMAGVDAAPGAVHPRRARAGGRRRATMPARWRMPATARRRSMAFDGLIDKGNLVLSERSSDDHPQPDRSAARQRGAGGAHAGAARPHRRLARHRGSSRRAVAARSVRFFLHRGAAHRRAIAMRAIKFRPTGRRRAARNCTRCASASSTCAIRWT